MLPCSHVPVARSVRTPLSERGYNLMPDRQNRPQEDTTQDIIARVNQPDLKRFRFPKIDNGEGRGGETDTEPQAEPQPVGKVNDRNSYDQTPHNQSRNEIRDKCADHFLGHSTSLKLHSMLLERSCPGFAEQCRIPDETQNPVG